jgi:hypothetical protein
MVPSLISTEDLPMTYMLPRSPGVVLALISLTAPWFSAVETAPSASDPITREAAATLFPWQERLVKGIGDQTLAEAPRLIELVAERDLALDLSWWLPGKDFNDPFPVNGQSVADCCTRLSQRLGAATMVIDDVPVFLSLDHQTKLMKPIRIAAGNRELVDTIDSIAQASGLNLNLDPEIIASTVDTENEPEMIGTTLEVLTAYLRRAVLFAEWEPQNGTYRITYLTTPKPILPSSRSPGAFTINGPQRALSLTNIAIDYKDMPVADVIRDLAKRLGVPVRIDLPLTGTIGLRVPSMRACEALRWIGSLAGVRIYEEHGQLVVGKQSDADRPPVRKRTGAEF